MSKITSAEIAAFSDTYRKIRERADFICEQRGYGCGEPLLFDGLFGDRPSIVVRWDDGVCGDTCWREEEITVSDLLDPDEAHILARKARIEARDAVRREEERAANERERAAERRRDLQKLRELRAKYPEET